MGLTPLPKSGNDEWFNKLPCGDKSHDEYKNQPALDSYVRSNCRISKSATQHVNKKGFEVIEAEHRKGAVSDEIARRVNEHLKDRWLFECGKMTGAELMSRVRKLQKNIPTDVQKYYGDEKKLREIVEMEEWEYLDREEANELKEELGVTSGKRIATIEGGLE